MYMCIYAHSCEEFVCVDIHLIYILTWLYMFICRYSCDEFTVYIFMEIHLLNIHVCIFTRRLMVYIRIHMWIFMWGFRMMYCRAYARVESRGAGVLYILLYTFMHGYSYCICACMDIHMMVRGARTYSCANSVLQGVAVTCSVVQCDAEVYVQIHVRINGIHTYSYVDIHVGNSYYIYSCILTSRVGEALDFWIYHLRHVCTYSYDTCVFLWYSCYMYVHTHV